MNVLPNRSDVEFADGTSYVVEIATGNEYKIYSYGALSLTANYFSEARTFRNILSFIGAELDIQGWKLD